MQITHKLLKDKHKEILLKQEVQIDRFYLISLIHNCIFWSVGSFLHLPDSAGTSVTPQSLPIKTITNSPSDSVGPRKWEFWEWGRAEGVAPCISCPSSTATIMSKLRGLSYLICGAGWKYMAQMSLAGHRKENILVLLPESDSGF